MMTTRQVNTIYLALKELQKDRYQTTERQWKVIHIINIITKCINNEWQKLKNYLDQFSLLSNFPLSLFILYHYHKLYKGTPICSWKCSDIYQFVVLCSLQIAYLI